MTDFYTGTFTHDYIYIHICTLIYYLYIHIYIHIYSIYTHTLYTYILSYASYMCHHLYILHSLKHPCVRCSILYLKHTAYFWECQSVCGWTQNFIYLMLIYNQQQNLRLLRYRKTRFKKKRKKNFVKLIRGKRRV